MSRVSGEYLRDVKMNLWLVKEEPKPASEGLFGGYLAGIEQFQFSGFCNRLCSAVHLKFAVDMVDVPLDRAHGNKETFPNFAIG